MNARIRNTALFLLLVLAPSLAVAQTARPVTFRTQTMGTWAALTIVTSDSARVADSALSALEVFHDVDSLMSNWTETSEVARINREAGRRMIEIDPEVADVIAYALATAAASDGAFDITVEPLVRLWGFLGGERRVPSQSEISAALDRTGTDKLIFDAKRRTLRFTRGDVRVDLGGIAKGYSVDLVAALLREAGVTNALVDLTGNMAAIGNSAGHPGWTVGIRDPSDQLPYVGRLRLYDQCVSTSGDYEQFVDADGRRYGHILDPRTGWSATGVMSVTVVSNNGMAADAWATALFVLGPERARRIASERDDLAVVLIEPVPGSSAIVWVEQPLRSRFDLSEDARDQYDVRYF